MRLRRTFDRCSSSGSTTGTTGGRFGSSSSTGVLRARWVSRRSESVVDLGAVWLGSILKQGALSFSALCLELLIGRYGLTESEIARISTDGMEASSLVADEA